MWLDINQLYEQVSVNEPLSWALSNFLFATKEVLVEAMTLLGKEKSTGRITTKRDGQPFTEERTISHGYITFRVPKKKKWQFREITIPDDRLRKLHEKLALRFGKVSLSTAALWSEKWSDHIQNALLHRENRYMYATDLKDAYPSVTSDRIFANLDVALKPTISFSYPYLEKEEITAFVLFLTKLVTHNDKLPQWLITSPTLLNIVMAWMDGDIISFLHKKNLQVQKPVYTRYVDDITVSYKDIVIPDSNKWKIEEHQNRIKELVALSPNESNEEIVSASKELIDLCYSYNCPWSIAYLLSIIENIQQLITTYYKRLKSFETPGKTRDPYRRVEKLILYIDAMSKRIADGKGKWFIEWVKWSIKKILANYGWELQPSKEHTRHPWSHKELREVTWVTINENGDLGIPKSKMDTYIGFLKTFLHEPQNLPAKFLKGNQPHAQKIFLSIKWKKEYVERIRGVWNLPSDYRHYYVKAMEVLKVMIEKETIGKAPTRRKNNRWEESTAQIDIFK